MAAVTLEPVDWRHVRDIQALAEDPAIGATTNLPEPYPADGAEQFVRAAIEKRASGEERLFAVIADPADPIDPEGPRLVGVCGLLGIRDGAGDAGPSAQAELGYWIGRPYWGRGYATAAARLAIDLAFRDLATERLIAMCLDSNAASWRILEKLGFRFTDFGSNPHPKWSPETRFAQFELPREVWRATQDSEAVGADRRT
ncbi:MAG TPA: GNAT family N-acetyltransferase [Thermoanaerobaculia bacterium]|jgi:RimJ/RimL family protein N-acetyltransferase|nr:GNAT family N-acetyltransferase [Thermoanaerobaculia bacterium]